MTFDFANKKHAVEKERTLPMPKVSAPALFSTILGQLFQLTTHLHAVQFSKIENRAIDASWVWSLDMNESTDVLIKQRLGHITNWQFQHDRIYFWHLGSTNWKGRSQCLSKTRKSKIKKGVQCISAVPCFTRLDTRSLQVAVHSFFVTIYLPITFYFWGVFYDLYVL